MSGAWVFMHVPSIKQLENINKYSQQIHKTRLSKMNSNDLNFKYKYNA